MIGSTYHDDSDFQSCFPETFSIDSLGACTDVSMTTDTLRVFQLYEDFANINYKDCSEVQWSKDMTTLPTVSKAFRTKSSFSPSSMSTRRTCARPQLMNLPQRQSPSL